MTLLWTIRLPPLQPSSPAALAASILARVLGPRVSEYVYVDFCSGAGGPTPHIEKHLNALLADQHPPDPPNGASASSSKGVVTTLGAPTRRNESTTNPGGVDFVLTDIAPHVAAWTAAAKRSAHLHFVSAPVDAAAAPPDLLSGLALSSRDHDTGSQPKQVFRLFSLAFHHFPDTLARAILADTLRSSAGFAVLELQARSAASLLTVLLIGPLLWLVAPVFFWRDPGFLFFTYVVPVIPFVVVFDGLVSSLRTRTGEEVGRMVEDVWQEMEGEAGTAESVGRWDVRWGSEWHTRPIGELGWVIGVKE